MEPLTGYRCELSADHEGDHRAIIDAHDELGPLNEHQWPQPGIHPDDWDEHVIRHNLDKRYRND
jgi:hypothetical protein